MDVPGDIGEELAQEVLDRVGGVAGEEPANGGGAIAMDAWDIEVRYLSRDGISEEGCVVGHGNAVVGPRDQGVGEGVDEPVRNARLGHAVITGILVDQGGNSEGGEGFKCRV